MAPTIKMAMMLMVQPAAFMGPTIPRLSATFACSADQINLSGAAD